ncbi:MAG: hypothetical protein D6814_17335, partial [Calditrichaeota bacterium]
MECHQFEEILQGVLDGTLEKLPAAAQVHLENCAICQKIHQESIELRNLLQQMPAPELNAAARNRLERAIHQRIMAAG